MYLLYPEKSKTQRNNLDHSRVGYKRQHGREPNLNPIKEPAPAESKLDRLILVNKGCGYQGLVWLILIKHALYSAADRLISLRSLKGCIKAGPRNCCVLRNRSRGD